MIKSIDKFKTSRYITFDTTRMRHGVRCHLIFVDNIFYLTAKRNQTKDFKPLYNICNQEVSVQRGLDPVMRGLLVIFFFRSTLFGGRSRRKAIAEGMRPNIAQTSWRRAKPLPLPLRRFWRTASASHRPPTSHRARNARPLFVLATLSMLYIKA